MGDELGGASGVTLCRKKGKGEQGQEREQAEGKLGSDAVAVMAGANPMGRGSEAGCLLHPCTDQLLDDLGEAALKGEQSRRGAIP